jgi:hypothetical protein
MNITKSQWHSDGNRLSLSVPFFKVDEERRMVSGFATLDNIDRQGDIVSADASVKAFESFRGNLREMHQPIAVGKVVNFRVEKFYDPESAEMYSGVFVDTYVSKGAQDTWEKVLDGTLSGFSIGGAIIDDEVVNLGDSLIRVIKSYELIELSLVDSPANQLANVFSVQKADGVSSLTGIVADLKMDNVFWCDSDQIAVTRSSDSPSDPECVVCTGKMSNIGWVESTDTAKNEEVGKIVDRYLSKNSEFNDSEAMPEPTEMTEQANETSKGGAVMQEDNNVEVTKSDEVVEEATEVTAEETVEKSDEATTEETVTEEADVVEKATDISEVEVEEPDFAKMLDDLKSFFGDNISKSATEAKAAVDEIVKGIETQIADFAQKSESLSNAISELQTTLANVEKRVELVEGDTAVKKSGDLDGSTEEVTMNKSIWSGSFLSVRDL